MHAAWVLPSVPEKRTILGPVCSCVDRGGGGAGVARPELPSSRCISLSVAAGSEWLNVTAQDPREQRRGLKECRLCSGLFPKAAVSCGRVVPDRLDLGDCTSADRCALVRRLH